MKLSKILFMLLNIMTLSTCLLLLSCSGYRVKQQSNPFYRHGIRKIAIPMFLNQSPLPGIGPTFTKSISLLLQEYTDLTIVSGEGGGEDAILLGILRTPRKRVFTHTQTQIIEQSRFPSIGSRRQFAVPRISSVDVQLTLILIKNPTPADRDLLISPLGEYIHRHPKVIFNQTIAVSANLDREILDYSEGKFDDRRVVNWTKNYGALKNRYDVLAQSAAQDFKDLIVNAY